MARRIETLREEWDGCCLKPMRDQGMTSDETEQEETSSEGDRLANADYQVE